MPAPQAVVAVVDDDEGMLKSLQRLLTAAGYEAETFPSAEAFLRSLASSSARFALLDIHLGGMSGIELRRRLSCDRSDISVIFMTAVDDAGTELEAIEAGCVAFLHKPFPASSLIDALSTAAKDVHG